MSDSRAAPVSDAKKVSREHIDGVLLLDKPLGPSSNGALQRAKWLLGAKKAGHTGTLDPLASGLLPICLGDATKFSAGLLEADKTYEATLSLGSTTDTGDAEGQVLKVRPVTATRADVEAVLPRFMGEVSQVPPMYSALKRDGRPLYDYARAGIELERAARNITIHALELNGMDDHLVRLTVTCSKGTYVRTLAEDIGEALGCGAHLVGLRRTRIAHVGLDRAVSLDELEAMSLQARRSLLLPVDSLLTSLPVLNLPDPLATRLRCGQRLASDDIAALECSPELMRVYAESGSIFLGLARCDAQGALVPVRLVTEAPHTNEKISEKEA